MNTIIIKKTVNVDDWKITLCADNESTINIVSILEASQFVAQYKIISGDYEELASPSHFQLEHKNFPKWTTKFNW